MAAAAAMARCATKGRWLAGWGVLTAASGTTWCWGVLGAKAEEGTPEVVPAGAAAPGVHGPGAAAVPVAWVEGECARKPRPAACGVAVCADAEATPRRWGDGSRLRAAARAEGRPAGGIEAGLRAAATARPGVAERPTGALGPAPDSGGRWGGGPFAAESCTPGRGMGVAGAEEAGPTPPRAGEGWRRAGGPTGVAGSLVAAAASPGGPGRGPVALDWVGSWCGK